VALLKCYHGSEGRNRKWLGAGSGRTVWVVRVDIVLQLSTGISQVGGDMDTFIVVNVVECRA